MAVKSTQLLTLIDDDPRFRTWVELALAERGYEVASAASGLTGLRAVVDRRPDLVLLDLGLPDIDGVGVLKMLRAVSSVPIIIVTASDGDHEMVRALDAGADDYVVKPFSIDHLEARVRAVIRRAQRAPTVTVGGVHIVESSRVATLDGTDLELTRKEFDLLAYLAAHAGRVVSKRELLAAVWDQPWGGGDKTVGVHISLLRHKLGETAGTPRYLRVVRGVGVSLVHPSEP